MSIQELENLVKIGQLKREPATRAEFNGMLSSARKRLLDSRNKILLPRVDLIWPMGPRTALLSPP